MSTTYYIVESTDHVTHTTTCDHVCANCIANRIELVSQRRAGFSLYTQQGDGYCQVCGSGRADVALSGGIAALAVLQSAIATKAPRN